MAFKNSTGLTPSELPLGLAGLMLLAAHDAPPAMISLDVLMNEEAARRLAEYGPNELTVAPRSTPWKLLLDQLKNLADRHFTRDSDGLSLPGIYCGSNSHRGYHTFQCTSELYTKLS